MAVTFQFEVKPIRRRRRIKFTSRMLNEVNRIWKGASRAATAAIALTTPVDTGMAMGSVLVLAKRLGMFEDVSSLIVPKRHGIKGYTTTHGNWRRDVPKHRGLGIRLATGGSFRYRLAKLKDTRLDFAFTFTTFQHILHNGGAPGFGSWNTLEAARQEFLAIIKENTKKMEPLLAGGLLFDQIKPIQLTTRIGGSIRSPREHADAGDMVETMINRTNREIEID